MEDRKTSVGRIRVTHSALSSYDTISRGTDYFSKIWFSLEMLHNSYFEEEKQLFPFKKCIDMLMKPFLVLAECCFYWIRTNSPLCCGVHCNQMDGKCLLSFQTRSTCRLFVHYKKLQWKIAFSGHFFLLEINWRSLTILSKKSSGKYSISRHTVQIWILWKNCKFFWSSNYKNRQFFENI